MPSSPPPTPGPDDNPRGPFVLLRRLSELRERCPAFPPRARSRFSNHQPPPVTTGLPANVSFAKRGILAAHLGPGNYLSIGRCIPNNSLLSSEKFLISTSTPTLSNDATAGANPMRKEYTRGEAEVWCPAGLVGKEGSHHDPEIVTSTRCLSLLLVPK